MKWLSCYILEISNNNIFLVTKLVFNKRNYNTFTQLNGNPFQKGNAVVIRNECRHWIKLLFTRV